MRGGEFLMDVLTAIEVRRAFRSLAPVEIGEDLIRDLARQAGLAPSCDNSQPWRFVFVSHPDALRDLHAALNSPGNDWARKASLIVAVFSKPDDDCQIKDRLYHQFDAGLAVGFLILRATELGLVAHPIAGFSPRKTREILGLPEGYQVITLVNIGRKADTIGPELSPKHREAEAHRPERLPLEGYAYLNRYGIPL